MVYAVIKNQTQEATGTVYLDFSQRIVDFHEGQDESIVFCEGLDDNGDLISPDYDFLKKERLKQIDTETIRPLRSVAEGTSVQADLDKITELENEAIALRNQIGN